MWSGAGEGKREKRGTEDDRVQSQRRELIAPHAFSRCRYKYLQKPFEETAIKGILQYLNKFSPVDQEKLAVSTALFVSSGLASANVLVVLKKDHLVKDCSSPSPTSQLLFPPVLMPAHYPQPSRSTSSSRSASRTS